MLGPEKSPAVGDSNSDYETQLRILVEGIAKMANLSGIRMKAHQPESWVHLATLPDLRKREILNHCKTFHSICESTLDDGRSLSDTKALLWSSLKYFGFVPCSELMNLITDDLVVELYDKDGRQIFRNFKFMEFCSYTLADVLLYQWWELFERNEEIVAQLLKEVGIVLSGQAKKSIYSSTPFHKTAEIFSERRHEFEMKFEMLSPIYCRSTKQPAGFVVTAHAKLLSVSNNRNSSTVKPTLSLLDQEASS